MLILLIRHGETDWNHQGRRQGRRDVPLNEAGREQMQRCADTLRGLPVDAILSSPLARATESAAILADALGVDAQTIRREAGLIERDFGDVDGMTDAELRAYRARGGNQKTEPLYLVRERMMRTVLNVARHEKHRNRSWYACTASPSCNAPRPKTPAFALSNTRADACTRAPLTSRPTRPPDICVCVDEWNKRRNDFSPY